MTYLLFHASAEGIPKQSGCPGRRPSVCESVFCLLSDASIEIF